jgi:hypothetical protein
MVRILLGDTTPYSVQPMACSDENVHYANALSDDELEEEIIKARAFCVLGLPLAYDLVQKHTIPDISFPLTPSVYVASVSNSFISCFNHAQKVTADKLLNSETILLGTKLERFMDFRQSIWRKYPGSDKQLKSYISSIQNHEASHAEIAQNLNWIWSYVITFISYYEENSPMVSVIPGLMHAPKSTLFDPREFCADMLDITLGTSDMREYSPEDKENLFLYEKIFQRKYPTIKAQVSDRKFQSFIVKPGEDFDLAHEKLNLILNHKLARVDMSFF